MSADKTTFSKQSKNTLIETTVNEGSSTKVQILKCTLAIALTTMVALGIAFAQIEYKALTVCVALAAANPMVIAGAALVLFAIIGVCMIIRRYQSTPIDQTHEDQTTNAKQSEINSSSDADLTQTTAAKTPPTTQNSIPANKSNATSKHTHSVHVSARKSRAFTSSSTSVKRSTPSTTTTASSTTRKITLESLTLQKESESVVSETHSASPKNVTPRPSPQIQASQLTQQDDDTDSLLSFHSAAMSLSKESISPSMQGKESTDLTVGITSDIQLAKAQSIHPNSEDEDEDEYLSFSSEDLLLIAEAVSDDSNHSNGILIETFPNYKPISPASSIDSSDPVLTESELRDQLRTLREVFESDAHLASFTETMLNFIANGSSKTEGNITTIRLNYTDQSTATLIFDTQAKELTINSPRGKEVLLGQFKATLNPEFSEWIGKRIFAEECTQLIWKKLEDGTYKFSTTLSQARKVTFKALLPTSVKNFRPTTHLEVANCVNGIVTPSKDSVYFENGVNLYGKIAAPPNFAARFIYNQVIPIALNNTATSLHAGIKVWQAKAYVDELHWNMTSLGFGGKDGIIIGFAGSTSHVHVVDKGFVTESDGSKRKVTEKNVTASFPTVPSWSSNPKPVQEMITLFGDLPDPTT